MSHPRFALSAKVSFDLLFDENGYFRFAGPFNFIGVYWEVLHFTHLEIRLSQDIEAEDFEDFYHHEQIMRQSGGTVNYSESYWGMVEEAAPKNYRPVTMYLGSKPNQHIENWSMY